MVRFFFLIPIRMVEGIGHEHKRDMMSPNINCSSSSQTTTIEKHSPLAVFFNCGPILLQKFFIVQQIFRS